MSIYLAKALLIYKQILTLFSFSTIPSTLPQADHYSLKDHRERERQTDTHTHTEKREMEETNSRFNRICVFCGSSSGKKASYQEAAVELGKELVFSIYHESQLSLNFSFIQSLSIFLSSTNPPSCPSLLGSIPTLIPNISSTKTHAIYLYFLHLNGSYG